MNYCMYELAIAEIHRNPNVNIFHLGITRLLPRKSLWKKFGYMYFLTQPLYLSVPIWILLQQWELLRRWVAEGQQCFQLPAQVNFASHIACFIACFHVIIENTITLGKWPLSGFLLCRQPLLQWPRLLSHRTVTAKEVSVLEKKENSLSGVQGIKMSEKQEKYASVNLTSILTAMILKGPNLRRLVNN